MSGSVDLLIETNSVWAIQMTWTDANNQPIPFSNPQMNIRQELGTSGKLLAKLDESGQFDGTIKVTAPGVLQAIMTADQTKNLPQSYGFWDIFVTVYGNVVRFAFGTISIAPHVTEVV